MTEDTKTERDLESPEPVGLPGSGAAAVPGARQTNGRLDTGVRLLAKQGAALHDGREQARKMAADPVLKAQLEKLASENPDGTGPFRGNVGPDLLPEAPPSERAEGAVIEARVVEVPLAVGGAALPEPITTPGLGPPVVEPETSPTGAPATEGAAKEATWPPFGEPGVRSDTLLEVNARKLQIPEKVFVVSRAMKEAANEEHQRLRATRVLIFAIVAGLAVVGIATLWVRTTGSNGTGVPSSLSAVAPPASVASPPPPATTSPIDTSPPAKSAASVESAAPETIPPAPGPSARLAPSPPRKPSATPNVASGAPPSRPPVPAPPPTQPAAGPIYD